MTTQRHKYEYKVEPNSAGAKVLRMVGQGKRVLEVGSGPGSITRLLKSNDCWITALELDERAIEIVSQYCERVLPCDLNTPGWASAVSKYGKFQAVVAADVLEHLYDPLATLRAMSSLLEEDGDLIVSLPHIGHNAVFACLAEADFAYQDWGLLDKTHIRFFGIRNIQQLFNDAGLKIIEAEFVVKPPEKTEFADRWRRAPSTLKRSLAHNRFGLVYQVVVKAKLAATPGKGIDLCSLPVPGPTSALPPGTPLGRRILHRLKGMLLPYLSLKNRTKLAHLLDRLGIKL